MSGNFFFRFFCMLCLIFYCLGCGAHPGAGTRDTSSLGAPMQILPDPSPDKALFCVLWRQKAGASDPDIQAALSADRREFVVIEPRSYAVVELPPGLYLMSSKIRGKENILGIQLVAGYTYYAEIIVTRDEINFNQIGQVNTMTVLSGLKRMESFLSSETDSRAEEKY